MQVVLLLNWSKYIESLVFWLWVGRAGRACGGCDAVGKGDEGGRVIYTPLDSVSTAHNSCNIILLAGMTYYIKIYYILLLGKYVVL